jgi:AcrR family transcriptional regulator
MKKTHTILPAGSGKRGRTLDRLLTAAQHLLFERTAGSLSITDVAARAQVAPGTFYNYFDGIDALVDELGRLLTIHHGRLLEAAMKAAKDPVEAFGLKTRQSLRFITESKDYGRLLFDAGLPVDRFLGGLRDDLHADIAAGVVDGVFRSDNPKLAASIVAGSVMGVALDLHRGRLGKASIDAATCEMLMLLGVRSSTAERVAHAAASFSPSPSFPLTWLSLAPVKARA